MVYSKICFCTQDVWSEDRQEFMVLRSEAALQVLLQGRGEKSYSLHLWNMFQRPALWVFMRLK